MKHIDGTVAGMSLYITSDSATSGTVSIPGQNWSTNFSITANNVTVVNVDVPKAYLECSDCIVTKGIRVETLKKVVVYAHHYQGARSDATLVLPTATLGKEYYIMSYQELVGFSSEARSEFIVIADKDNTKVNITPSVAISRANGGTRPAGTTYQITLNAGQIYQGIASGNSSDLTGTHVQVIDTGSTANCRTVAVFSGSSFTSISNGCTNAGTADNLTEQLYPTTSWGNKFVLVPALGRSSDNFRFIARENSTQIVITKSSGAPDIANLNSGDVYDLNDVSTVRNVSANKPVMVAQFQKTARCDGGGNSTGDPSMTILNPLEQTLKDITLYSSQFFNIDNHYINVVIRTFYASSFRIDGKSVSFTNVPRNGQYSYARISVSQGNHRLTANGGFIATAYGEGRVESYGYAAGANVKDLTAVAGVKNSPQINEISGCLGRPTEFKGEAEYDVVRWEWDFGDGNKDTIQNPSHTYADTGTYVATMYTYKPSFDGCSSYDSSEVEVKIYDNPIAKMVWTPLCDGGTAVFSDSSSIPAGEEYLYSKWIIDGATTFSKSTTHSFDTVGKAFVLMEVSTSKQCKDTVSDSLIINPKPNTFFTVDDVCFQDSAFFINQSTVATGTIDSFFWQFSGDTSVYINENPSYFFADSGYYDAYLSVKTDSGCKASFDSFVYKHPRFDVAFSYVDTCFGIENQFTNTTILDGGKYTDTTWFLGNSDTSYSFNSSFTFDTPGTYNVQLVMEQSDYCRDSFERQVTVDPIPVPDFEVENTCLRDETAFRDLSSISSGFYNVDWNFDDGLTGTGIQDTVVYSSGGIKTVTITVTSDQGCSADSTKDVTVTFPSISSIQVNDVCLGTTQEIGAVEVLGLDSFSHYQWSIAGEGFIGTRRDSSIEYTATTAGVKTIYLYAITKNGCAIPYSTSFEVFEAPRANFFITPVCQGQNVLPTDNSTIEDPGSITGYKWFVDGLQVSDQQNPVISITAAGNQDLMQVVESANGCTDTITKVIFVNANPVSSFTSTNLCDGDVTNFVSTSTISAGSITSTLWTIDGTDRTGTTTNNTFGAAGDYSVRLITESDNSCADTITQTVTIHPLPELDIALEEYAGCVPFDISVINNSIIASGGITSYEWTWGDGNASTRANPSYTYNNPGSYDVRVKATSDQGCSDSIDLSSQVTVFDLPIADFSFTPREPSTITEFVTFTDSSQGNIVNYDWNTSDGGSYTGSTTQHTFSDSGTFTVTLVVEDDNGCIDEEIKTIYINADLFVHIPTSFTPNGDLINDTYGLGGLIQGVVELDMKIYNRWGELIFQSKDANDRWDGTYDGEPVQEGVYIYLIRFTNPKNTEWYNYKGEIHLLR